jgi:hypothetical protein
VSGWVPIPQVAIDAVGRQGRGALLDLYDRAHRTGYAPRPWTERELAEEWALDRRVVVRVLDALVRAGVIEIERAPPGARQPSLLQVLPAVASDVHQTRNQTRNQTTSQNSAGLADTFRQSAPVNAPAPAPAPAPPRAEIFPRGVEIEIRDQDQEQQQAELPRPARTRDPGPPVQEQRPAALQATAPPQEAEPDPIVGELARKLRVPARVVPLIVRAVSAIRGRDVKLQRCATDAEHVVKLQRAAFTPWEQLVEDIELVARWAHESDDPMAARNLRAEGWEEGRDRSRDVSTLLTQKAWGDRLEAATQWADQQRPRPVVEQPPEPPEESMLDEWERLGRPRIRGHDDDEDSISSAIRQRGVRRDRRQPTA